VQSRMNWKCECFVPDLILNLGLPTVITRLEPGAQNLHLGQTAGHVIKASSQRKLLLCHDEIFTEGSATVVDETS